MSDIEKKPPPQSAQNIRLSQNMQQACREITKILDAAAGGPVLWSLITWNRRPTDRVQYAANVARPEAAKALEEILERWKSPMPDVPAHEVD